MRLSLDSLYSENLLAPATTARKKRKDASPKAKAEAHRIEALKALRHWGHLRCGEIARLLWPHARYGEQMSQRLMRHLDLERGEVLARANAMGSTSYVLTRRGAAALEAMNLSAKHGLELSSVAGSTFRHRSLEVAFGISKILQGHDVYGEHAIAQGIAPVTRDVLSRRFGKLPDLLVIVNQRSVYWAEVESSAKQTKSLQDCLRITAQANRPIAPDSSLMLSGLIFVFDASQGHAQRIARAARLEWRDDSASKRELVARRVTLAAIEVGAHVRWEGMRESPLPL